MRRRGPSGGGAGVRRQHGGSRDRGGADRQAVASVRVLQGGVGGRPRDVHRGAHPRGGEAVRSGLDQRVAGSGGAVPGGIRRGAAIAVRRDRPGGDPKRRLSGRAPHGVPQSAAGGGAGAQAGRSAPGHRGVARSHRGGREAGEAAPEGRGQDRRARGQGRRQIQDGQALRSGYRGRRVRLSAKARVHRRRSGAGRLVRRAHQLGGRRDSTPRAPCAPTSA